MWLLTVAAAWALPGPTTAYAVVQDANPRVECATLADGPWCRSIGTIDRPIDRVAAVLEDMPKFRDRFPRILALEMLEPDTLHVVLDYPAGLSDRDYVARYTKTTDGDARLLRWVPVTHPKAPETDGVVRLPRMAGEWRLEPVDADTTRVTYLWQAEIGGSFPTFLAARARSMTGTEALSDLAAATR